MPEKKGEVQHPHLPVFRRLRACLPALCLLWEPCSPLTQSSSLFNIRGEHKHAYKLVKLFELKRVRAFTWSLLHMASAALHLNHNLLSNKNCGFMNQKLYLSVFGSDAREVECARVA